MPSARPAARSQTAASQPRIDWPQEAKRHLKRELQHADVGYAELARRLTEMGVPTTEGSFGVRIIRGRFPAWFLLAVLRALGVEALQLD